MTIHRSSGVSNLQRKSGLPLLELARMGYVKIDRRRSTWGDEWWVLTKKGVALNRKSKQAVLNHLFPRGYSMAGALGWPRGYRK